MMDDDCEPIELTMAKLRARIRQDRALLLDRVFMEAFLKEQETRDERRSLESQWERS